MAPGDQKESGRPAVDGCASPLRIQKERPFFPTFGDEERLSFFARNKVLFFVSDEIMHHGICQCLSTSAGISQPALHSFGNV